MGRFHFRTPNRGASATPLGLRQPLLRLRRYHPRRARFQCLARVEPRPRCCFPSAATLAPPTKSS